MHLKSGNEFLQNKTYRFLVIFWAYAVFFSFQKMPYFLYSWLQKIESLILIYVTDDLNSGRSSGVRQTRHLSKLRKAWRSMFSCTAMHFQPHKFCTKYKYLGERFFKNRKMSVDAIFSSSKQDSIQKWIKEK